MTIEKISSQAWQIKNYRDEETFNPIEVLVCLLTYMS